jgi:YesN/AraC family two-component response regulator
MTQAGYRCKNYRENGATGLESFTELKDEVCLIPADIILPAVNGINMAECILQVSRYVKILVMSAYSENVIEQQGRNRFRSPESRLLIAC